MPISDNEADVAQAMAAYAAPAPREAFSRALLDRLQTERRAERTVAEAARHPRAVPRIGRWMAAAAAVLLLVIVSWAYSLKPLIKEKIAGLWWTSAVVATPHSREFFQDQPSRPAVTPTEPMAAAPVMVPLAIAYPKPLFEGTPKNIKPHPYLEKYVDAPRPPFLVPEGTVNLALGKPVTSSDNEPIIGELKMVTDGDKEATDGSFVELGPAKQWVQIDLKGPCAIYAILVWHYHGEGRVYHDFVVQVADDPDFIEGVRTLYNNDFDNSSGLGLGKELEYIEDFRGRLIDTRGAACEGVKARYVRLYSKGNTSNDQNHYIEVEVHGKPAPAATVTQGRPSLGPVEVHGKPVPAAAGADKQAPLSTPLPKAMFD
jgi:hypothetical protein